MSLGWSLAAVPLLIALNAFFVAAEYALVAIRPAQIESLRARGRRGAARAVARLKARPADAIGAIQVCITMTNLLLGWIGEPAMSELLRLAFGRFAGWMPPALFAGLSFALSFVIVTLLTVVFSELLPKALTIRYVPVAARFTAVPVLLIQRAIRPLVWLMNAMGNLVTVPLGLGRVDALEEEKLSADELVLLTSEAAAHGALTQRERSLILNSLALGRRTARHVMVPRLHVKYLDLRKSMDDNREAIGEYLYSRMPLCDGGLDKVVGVVPVKEFLHAYHAAADASVLSLLVQPAVFLPEGANLDQVLAAFVEAKAHMILLVDEYGGVEGLVTLRDVVDELLSTVPASAPEPLDDGERVGTPAAPAAPPADPFAVPGDLPLHDLAARLGRPDWAAGENVVTVGGLVVARLGEIPAPGREVDVAGVRLRTLDADHRAVHRVEVRVLPSEVTAVPAQPAGTYAPTSENPPPPAA